MPHETDRQKKTKGLKEEEEEEVQVRLKLQNLRSKKKIQACGNSTSEKTLKHRNNWSSQLQQKLRGQELLA
jgi:molecular chaperone DnaK (HSP70)